MHEITVFHPGTDYSTLILGVFSLDQIAHVGRQPALSYSAVKLLSKNSNLYDCDHSIPNVTDRQSVVRTDRWTDDLLRHYRALRCVLCLFFSRDLFGLIRKNLIQFD